MHLHLNLLLIRFVGCSCMLLPLHLHRVLCVFANRWPLNLHLHLLLIIFVGCSCCCRRTFDVWCVLLLPLHLPLCRSPHLVQLELRRHLVIVAHCWQCIVQLYTPQHGWSVT